MDDPGIGETAHDPGSTGVGHDPTPGLCSATNCTAYQITKPTVLFCLPVAPREGCNRLSSMHRNQTRAPGLSFFSSIKRSVERPNHNDGALYWGPSRCPELQAVISKQWNQGDPQILVLWCHLLADKRKTSPRPNYKLAIKARASKGWCLLLYLGGKYSEVKLPDQMTALFLLF